MQVKLWITVQELVSKLQTMNDIIPKEKRIFVSASKEKAWHNFHSMLPSLKEAVIPVVGDPQLAMFVCLQVAEHIINKKFVLSEEVGIIREAEGLTGTERDIVSYIAGFVLFSCKKYFQSVQCILNVIEKLTDTDGSSKLISVKSRGGLTQPSSAFVDFIMLLEFVFRKLCNSTTIVPLRQHFVNSVCQDARVVGVFYTSTYHTYSDTAIQEKLMLHVINLFHRVRCHAKCRQTIEKFHSKMKSAGKQKSLRNSIDH